MDFSVADEDLELVRAFREYLAGLDPERLAAASSFDILDMSDEAYRLRRQFGEDGWLALSWPVEYGGRGATALQEWFVREELAARRLPQPGLSITSIGPTLILVGTERQKRELLPGLRDGSLLFCLGYTEPEAGSDLASLRTTARRHDDDYVVDGQKIYTSGAHHASHIWVAARTDPAAPKREGISIFIVPTDAPGVTITPLVTQAGGRSNQVFFDAVTVPASSMVGAEHAGWDIIRTALDFERTSLVPWSAAGRDLWDVARTMSLDAAAPGRDGDGHADSFLDDWAELVVDVEMARALLLRTVSMVDSGRVPRAEASMAKVWVAETRMRIASMATNALGPDAQFLVGDGDRSAQGDLSWLYLFSPVKVFGGGTNEIQRQIIARSRLSNGGR